MIRLESETKTESSSGDHKLYKKAIANLYEVYVGDFCAASAKELSEIFYELNCATDKDELILRIDSFGGSIDELIRFKNIIDNKFNNRTSSYLDPKGYSCGAFIFCLANKRIVYKDSAIMFHSWSGWLFGKSNEISQQFKFNDVYLKNFISSILLKFFSKDEINALENGADYWFSIDEMCERGIATHCVIDGVEITAEEYLKTKKPQKTKKGRSVKVKDSKKVKKK